MALLTVNPTFDAAPLREKFDLFFAALGRGFTVYVERKSRAREIAALNAKTDEQLAAMGIRRDQIAVYVFRDMFYV